METTKQIVENINKKANSFQFRYAGVGTEVKIYFDKVTDLFNQLKDFSDKRASIKQELDEIKKTFKEVE